MKKIMFSKEYGMEQAVLERLKTMTRRVFKAPITNLNEINRALRDSDNANANKLAIIKKYAQHHVGEVVAVAQCYEDAWQVYQERWESYNDPSNWRTPDAILGDAVQETKGWRNKMFVKADLMPHLIRITNIKVEPLQDISDEDCRKEGIMEGEFTNTWDTFYYDHWGDVPNHITFRPPRQAFASLIDKISGKGTWQKNPWVFAYEFELVQ